MGHREVCGDGDRVEAAYASRRGHFAGESVIIVVLSDDRPLC